MIEFEGEKAMTHEEFKAFFFAVKEEAKKDYASKIKKVSKLKNTEYVGI